MFKLTKHKNIFPGLTGGPRAIVYTGPDLEYLDASDVLKPYTSYDYMVTASNDEGQVASEWETVRTNEAPPRDVPAPRVTVSGPKYNMLSCLYEAFGIWELCQYI